VEVTLIVRAIRFILAILIGLSLAIAPAAAMAAPATPMDHCGKKDMGDCSCCDKANACRHDGCGAKCAKIPGLAAPSVRPLNRLARIFKPAESTVMASAPWPPPSPPPRT
jgi:hypothetical protein